MSASIGRLVHYRLPDLNGQPRWRPALIVNGPFGDESLVNLTVFLDGLNDGQTPADLRILSCAGDPGGVFMSVGSAREGAVEGSWRLPPRAEEAPGGLDRMLRLLIADVSARLLTLDALIAKEASK